MPVAQLERIRSGLAELEPEWRALLELSVRRQVPDTDIARLLHVDPEDVHRRRDLVIDGLAGRLGLGTREEIDELRATLPELTDELWGPAPNGNGAPSVQAPAAAVREVEAVPEIEAGREVEALHDASERPSPRALTWAGVALLALVAGGAVLALVSGDGDEASPQEQQLGSPRASPFARLQALPGTKARGTARLEGRALRLRAADLPPARGGFFEAWVYNSLGDARSIGRLYQGALNAKLPDDARRYRFVDVSREPRDGNPGHSGASVARVPGSALRR